MKILITSGGTAEKIDSVRAITNQATGQLGKVMAETFLSAGHEVTLVTTAKTVRPESSDRLTIVQVSDVASLIETLEPLVKSHHALIHSMAVSDYTPIYMTDFESVTASSDLTSFLNQSNQESKISSQADYQVLFLKKTPKVISLVKDWNPTIQLIGFKLLVDVTEQELLQVARASLAKNRADYILANDLSKITSNQHLAYLVSQNKEEKAETKAEIAQLILSKIDSKEV